MSSYYWQSFENIIIYSDYHIFRYQYNVSDFPKYHSIHFKSDFQITFTYWKRIIAGVPFIITIECVSYLRISYMTYIMICCKRKVISFSYPVTITRSHFGGLFIRFQVCPRLILYNLRYYNITYVYCISLGRLYIYYIIICSYVHIVIMSYLHNRWCVDLAPLVNIIMVQGQRNIMQT